MIIDVTNSIYFFLGKITEPELSIENGVLYDDEEGTAMDLNSFFENMKSDFVIFELTIMNFCIGLFKDKNVGV